MSQTSCPINPPRILTLTGADDTVTPEALAEFADGAGRLASGVLEFGFLVSKSRAGSHRFPSPMHLDRMIDALLETDAQLALHVCGQWTREIMQGEWTSLLDAIGYRFEAFHRVQLNFHAEPHLVSDAFFSETKRLMMLSGFDLILQSDGTNASLFDECERHGLEAFGLFDLSGGAGRLPLYWPNAVHDNGGYAGGLGPENLTRQLPVIAAAASGHPYWIDMETRLYDEDLRFSLDRCGKVVEIVNAFATGLEAAA